MSVTQLILMTVTVLDHVGAPSSAEQVSYAIAVAAMIGLALGVVARKLRSR